MANPKNILKRQHNLALKDIKNLKSHYFVNYQGDINSVFRRHSPGNISTRHPLNTHMLLSSLKSSNNTSPTPAIIQEATSAQPLSLHSRIANQTAAPDALSIESDGAYTFKDI